MLRVTRCSVRVGLALAAVLFLALGASTQVAPDLYSGLQWRMIGPYHGGRVAAVSGAIGQPGTFYAGMPQGGIWKTTSGGTTWFPIFDQIQGVDSVGSVFVAPSDPNIIYAGSGDAITQTPVDGDGMYKSTDAGKTWAHIGLEGTTRIPKLFVDPKNPNIVLAATMGGTLGNQRGVFRSDDGGKNWVNVLHPDDQTGARDMSSPFDMPNVIFVTTMADGAAPAGGGGGGRGAAPAGPTRTKLYKSTDEGKTWTEIGSNPETTGRLCVAAVNRTNAQRLYVYGSGGLYRSDDQGATWKHMAADDTRVRGSDYTTGVWADTQNPDTVITLSTAAYISRDGGQTFTGFKGAPGGEDMHEIWMDPTNDQRMVFGVDQGAPVSFDGGHTWSSYYALPIDQVYHISTDNRYPYWVMASQQDTGAVMVRARGDVGDISEVDWMPLPSSEFGTVTADPSDPNVIYGVGYGAAGGGSGLVKINLATGQWENMAPNFGADASKYRSGRDAWRRFDPFDKHAMYMDMQCLIVSRDGGHNWKAVSPDLTTEKGQPQVACGTPPPATAAPAAPAAGGRGGAGGASISDFAISTLKPGIFWTVSSNGQIYNSMDAGLHWSNVSNVPDAEGVTINVIEAGTTDAETAYICGRAGGGGRGARAGGAAEDRNAPLVWRTHDGGKTWTKIVTGLPSDERDGSWVNVVRQDPRQKGLLFAGTESTVYVSFDDGDHWQSLRQNLPSTSIRDMVFHTDDHMSDLVIGTYGRSFYVLDDTTPLREVAAKTQAIASAPAYFFKPGDAIRARVSDNWDQPLNPELPHSPNPPYGAIFYYHLSQKPAGPIQMQVFDSAGKLVRTMSSVPRELPEKWPYPDYWHATPEELALPTNVGTNRFHWDLRYDDPPTFSYDLENQMNVAPGGTVTPGPHGMQVIPGVYTMKLTVDGQTYTQTVTVRNDPRVGESAKVMADLRAKDHIMTSALAGAKQAWQGNTEVADARAQMAKLSSGPLPADLAKTATELDAKLAKFGGVAANLTGARGGGGGAGGRGGRGGPAPGEVVPFNTVNGSFDTLISLGQVGLDEAPSPSEVHTWEADCKTYNATLAAWKTLLSQDLVQFNSTLTKASQQPLNVPPTRLTPAVCSTAAAPAAAAPAAAKH